MVGNNSFPEGNFFVEFEFGPVISEKNNAFGSSEAFSGLFLKRQEL
jgi:hypothetical protein